MPALCPTRLARFVLPLLAPLLAAPPAVGLAADALGTPGASPPPLVLTGRIAFDDFADVYVANADGSGLVRLTSDPGPEFDPDWSPDGTKIAYRDSTRGINGDDEVFVMDADGSHKTNLTNNPANDWGPAWSPDGTRIAFNSARGEGGLPQ